MELTWNSLMDSAVSVDRTIQEKDLIASSLQGDGQAFADLVRRHEKRVFRLVGRFFRKRADVEDVAQETFLTAWRKLATYKARAPFEHWLTRVCLNCCYAQLRKVRRPTEPLHESMSVREEDPTLGVEIERMLAPLAAADRFVLLMLYGEGWSVAEIAQRLGWTQVNVKVRAHRAKKRLRALLEES